VGCSPAFKLRRQLRGRRASGFFGPFFGWPHSLFRSRRRPSKREPPFPGRPVHVRSEGDWFTPRQSRDLEP
jgi:hypothetical protein